MDNPSPASLRSMRPRLPQTASRAARHPAFRSNSSWTLRRRSWIWRSARPGWSGRGNPTMMTNLTARLFTVGCATAMVVGFIFNSHAAARANAPYNATDEIREVESRIDRTEAETLAQMKNGSGDQFRKIELLGKLLLFDRELSVNRNEACAFCHMPETGFTGPVSELNRTTGSYPGSVRTRFSNRRPQSHAYAPLSPVLHYNPGQDDLVGGNFWDMRATGRRLGNPAAEQAEGPPINPVEMGLPDIAW